MIISEDWITLSLRSWILTGPIEAMDSKPQHEECLESDPDDDDDCVNLRQGVGLTAVKCEMSGDDIQHK